jgi:hypothetical protein
VGVAVPLLSPDDPVPELAAGLGLADGDAAKTLATPPSVSIVAISPAAISRPERAGGAPPAPAVAATSAARFSLVASMIVLLSLLPRWNWRPWLGDWRSALGGV